MCTDAAWRSCAAFSHLPAPRPGGVARAAALAVAVGVGLCACGPDAPPIEPARYDAREASPACDSGAVVAPPPVDLLATPGGARFRVRAPSNYDPRRAHPLLVVFAPAGFGTAATEAHAGLTGVATRAGFVIAFAEHRPLSPAWVRVQGEIPAAVMRHWCIDPTRVVLAGHSDGGTVAQAAAFLQAVTPAPAAVLASGAGIRAEDLAGQSCPPPLSVLVFHSRDDAHFPPPGFGPDMARWWAECNRCRAEPGMPDASGCRTYDGCAVGTSTTYCETRGAHASWNTDPARVMDLATRLLPQRR